ncbi:MAG TPA: homoserine kinase [Gemmatimonadaceae bacterium]|nr:homoserine kinase [Gemmatimonadaceae bacterium]
MKSPAQQTSSSRPPARARAFAPGGIGNIGPGLDILGCAVTGPGDTVDIEWGQNGSAPIVVVDAGHPDLPTDPTRHASAIAATAVLRIAGATSRGLVLRARKGLPLAGGQGGSAASAVAGAVAANALLGGPLDDAALLQAALEAESTVAGRHADNIGSALLGGLVLVRSMDPLDVVSLPLHADPRIVLALPAQRLRTAEARSVLPASLDRAVALHQAAQVAAMVAAFGTGDLELLRRALDDRIAEPARAPLLPGFLVAKSAALHAGALGCSISGAGPTSFAFAADDASAARVAAAMQQAYARAGVSAEMRVARIERHGARVELLSESDVLQLPC